MVVSTTTAGRFTGFSCLTGDECGIIKEFVVVSDPSKVHNNGNNKDPIPPNNKFNNSTVPVLTENDCKESTTTNIKNGTQKSPIIRPVNFDPNNVSYNNSKVMDRRYGIVDITSWTVTTATNNKRYRTKIEEDDDDDVQPNSIDNATSLYFFATLSMNGTVQVWKQTNEMNQQPHSNTTRNVLPYQRLVCMDDVFGTATVPSSTKTTNNVNNKDNDENNENGNNNYDVDLNNDDEEFDDDDDDHPDEEEEEEEYDDDDDDDDENDNDIDDEFSHQQQPPLDPLVHGLAIQYWDEKDVLIACNVQGKVISIDIGNVIHQQQQQPTSTTENETDMSDDMTTTVTTATLLYIYGKDAAPTNTTKSPHYPVLSTFCMYKNYIAAGGKDRETVVYDLNDVFNDATMPTGMMDTIIKPFFKAKNLPPNPQTSLQPQVWPTAITFLPNYKPYSSDDDNTSTSTSSGLYMAVGSAYKQIRVYDILSIQRRPIQFTPEGAPIEYRITTLCQNSYVHPNLLYIGDCAGYIHRIDLHTLPRGNKDSLRIQTTHGTSIGRSLRVERYVGPAGSIRSMKLLLINNNDTNMDPIGSSSTTTKKTTKSKSNSYLAVVGLDRMLRIYNTANKKQIFCVYLKQRLNCCCQIQVPFALQQMNQKQQQVDRSSNKKRKTNSGNDNDNNDDDDDVIQDYYGSSDDANDVSDDDDDEEENEEDDTGGDDDDDDDDGDDDDEDENGDDDDDLEDDDGDDDDDDDNDD